MFLVCINFKMFAFTCSLIGYSPDGLRLYSGVKGADFYCYKGLTIFEMNSRKVAEIDGTKYSVLDALGRL